MMEEIEGLLREYLILPKGQDEEDPLYNETEDLGGMLISMDNWAVFFEKFCDAITMCEGLDPMPDDKRKKIFKFGISCLVHFVQANFTGPQLDESIVKFLDKHNFEKMELYDLLYLDEEEINVNIKYPTLLFAAKLIFELCEVNTVVNSWWYIRFLMVHQQVLDGLSPTLLTYLDQATRQLVSCLNIKGYVKALLDTEIAWAYMPYRQILKIKEHIDYARSILALEYEMIGALGKRTKHQEKAIAQLSLKITVKEPVEATKMYEMRNTYTTVPQDISLKDDVRLNSIVFEEELTNKVTLNVLHQKLLTAIVQEMLISKPQDELQTEEITPFLNVILQQKHSYPVRVFALLLRCKLETRDKRAVERAMAQCEEIVKSLEKPPPTYSERVPDAFGSGLTPIWRVKAQLGEILLNLGLVKDALNVYEDIQRWEEVVVCYTAMQLKHKAAEVIQKQIDIKPTVKLLCLLGDAKNDELWYDRAWALSGGKSHRAQKHWGRYLYDRKQYEESIPHLEKSLEINPLQHDVWFRLAYAAHQTEDWNKAANAYRRTVHLEPDGFEAWNNLAQAYLKLDKKIHAHQALSEALRCNFENWKVWENYLLVSSDLCKFPDVIKAYERLLDLRDRYFNLPVLNRLVTQAWEHGEPPARLQAQIRRLLHSLIPKYRNEGSLWEMYSMVATNPISSVQELLQALKCYTRNSWEKDPSNYRKVVSVCFKLSETVLTDGVVLDRKVLYEVRLEMRSVLLCIERQDYDHFKLKIDEMLKTVWENLRRIEAKLASGS